MVTIYIKKMFPVSCKNTVLYFFPSSSVSRTCFCYEPSGRIYHFPLFKKKEIGPDWARKWFITCKRDKKCVCNMKMVYAYNVTTCDNRIKLLQYFSSDDCTKSSGSNFFSSYIFFVMVPGETGAAQYRSHFCSRNFSGYRFCTKYYRKENILTVTYKRKWIHTSRGTN